MVLGASTTPADRIWCLFESFCRDALDLPLDLVTKNGCLTKCEKEGFANDQNKELKADILSVADQLTLASTSETTMDANVKEIVVRHADRLRCLTT